MKYTIHTVLIIIAAVALIIGALWGGIRVYAWLAPQQAAAERKVFNETPSFVLGKIEYLTRLKYQYDVESSANARLSLSYLIRAEASSINPKKLPYELQKFLKEEIGPRR